MKKFITMITACGLLLGACSQNEPVVDEAGTVTFKVTAVNSIQTRGDIYSSSAAGTIPALANVQVLAFKDDGSSNFLYTQSIDLTTAYTPATNSAQQKLADGTIAAGSYKFLGIGQVADDGYTLPTLEADVTNYDAIAASVTSAGANTNVIFAGTKAQEVLATGANIEIDISRQVAGLFGYFANVPTEISNTPVQYLRLRVSNANLAVNLGTGVGDATTATGASYYALEIDFTGQPVDAENNVYRGVVPPSGVVVAENSQIVSNYAIPIDGLTTMTLELQSADGTALKTWTVQDANGGNIDLKANVLMAIGLKNRADSQYGADDTDDTTTAEDETGTPNQDDTPVSLLTDETIIVNALPNWNDVQNLILEEQQPVP